MAFDYAPITATASSLLSDFGVAVSIRRFTQTGTNPVAGTVTRSSADTAAKCVRTQFSQRNTPEGFTIEQGDWLGILNAEVLISDRIVEGSDVWEVVNVLPVKPGSTGIIWKAQLRK